MKKNMIQTAKNHELGTVGAIKTFIVHRKIFDIDLFLNSKREQLKKFLFANGLSPIILP